MEYPILNKYQTQITQELIDGLPKEIADNLLEIVSVVPFVGSLISENRERAMNRPRDSSGRIIVDLTNPHIIEDMDYFQPAAKHYKKYGVYNKARPNSNANSEFGKWIRIERDRCWNGMVRESDGEWIPGLLYFYMNYCPIIQSKIRKGTKQADRIVDFPEMWEGIYWRFHYIHQARNGGLHNNFEGGNHGAELASRGKAFAYSQNIETPNGRKKWGDIKIGDYLFAPDSTLTKVIDIPFDQEHDIYKITLIDGQELFTTLEHLWKINKNNENWGKLYTTEQIMKSSQIHRHAIEVSKGVDYEYKEVPIEPYFLGLMIGDGSFTTSSKNVAQFSSRKEDIETYEKHTGLKFREVSNTGQNWLITYPSFGDKLKELNLQSCVHDTKFIPECYKYNTREVRLELLKGLLDTDGSVHDSGKAELYTTSKQLANDTLWLVRSLGYNGSMWVKDKPKYKHKGLIKEGKPCYIIYIYTNDILFKLDRKINHNKRIESIKLNSRVVKTSIKSIEYSHREMAKCVTVDREDGLFLVGDFTMTHNSKSYSMASILAHNFVIGESRESWQETRSIATAYQKEYLIKDGVLNKFVSMIDFVAQHTQFPRKRLKSAMQDMDWIMGYKDAELNINKGTQNQVLGVSSKDDESKLRGKRAVFIGIEEFGTFKRLLDLYNVLLPSVQEGDYVFGLMYLQGCVCAGTKVWNKYGELLNIEDLKQSDGIIGNDNGYPSIEPITWMQPPTKKECVKIQLEDRYLECSMDHPILTRTLHTPRDINDNNKRNKYYTYDFKPAGSLTTKDYVCISHYQGVFGKESLFDGRLVGMLIGDGSYGFNQTPKFSNADIELLEYIKSKYEYTTFKQHVTKDVRNYEEMRIRNICSKLREIGIYGQTKTNKRLPVKYQLLDKQSAALLLAGLYDTDGSISFKGTSPNIILTQSSLEILKEVQILLSKFGVYSRIYTQKARIKENRKDVNDCFNLIISREESIRNFKNDIPLLSNTKKMSLKKVINIFDNKIRKNNIIQRPYSVIESKVQSIKNIGLQDIYNLTAGKTNTYLANGIITHNTAGDNESDFAGAQEIMYNPHGYNMYALPNVFDKSNQGKKQFVFFFPGYINRKGFYNQDGVSDVIGGLLSILKERYKVKYNSTDPNTIIKTIAEVPITPAEAIIKTGVNLFPVIDLTERLNQIDNNIREFDDVYTGDLIILKSGEVEYKNTNKTPIRSYKSQDNKMEGAIEIFQLPEKGNDGKVFSNRYILSGDPYDNDQANSKSLGSIFVLDLWTDRIVAEYTGRPAFADEFYEIARRMCLFFNGRMNYENNKKGLFAYFQRMNSLYLLTDTLEFLKDKNMIKSNLFGNNTKGTTATAPINSYARTLLRNWLLQPVTMAQNHQDDETEITVAKLFTMKSRAAIEELISYNELGNFDRVSSLMMLMLLREDKMIMYNGNLLSSKSSSTGKDYLGDDPFFTKNYTRVNTGNK